MHPSLCMKCNLRMAMVVWKCCIGTCFFPVTVCLSRNHLPHLQTHQWEGDFARGWMKWRKSQMSLKRVIFQNVIEEYFFHFEIIDNRWAYVFVQVTAKELTFEKITNNKFTFNEQLLIFKKPDSCIYAKMPLNEITHNNKPPFDKKKKQNLNAKSVFVFS